MLTRLRYSIDQLVQYPELLEKMSEKAQNVTDGSGAHRVAGRPVVGNAMKIDILRSSADHTPVNEYLKRWIFEHERDHDTLLCAVRES